MPRIHWRRVLAGAFLAEVSVLALFFLLLFLANLAGRPEIARPMSPLDYADAMIASFGAIFLFTLWVCRRVESGFVLHGALTGLTAILLFVTLIFAVNRTFAEPALYWVAHGLKVAGGMAGGVVAGRRRPRSRAS